MAGVGLDDNSVATREELSCMSLVYDTLVALVPDMETANRDEYFHHD